MDIMLSAPLNLVREQLNNYDCDYDCDYFGPWIVGHASRRLVLFVSVMIWLKVGFLKIIILTWDTMQGKWIQLEVSLSFQMGKQVWRVAFKLNL